MTPDNKLNVKNAGALGSAHVYPDSGGVINGHLSVDEDGFVRFIEDPPNQDPEKE